MLSILLFLVSVAGSIVWILPEKTESENEHNVNTVDTGQVLAQTSKTGIHSTTPTLSTTLRLRPLAVPINNIISAPPTTSPLPTDNSPSSSSDITPTPAPAPYTILEIFYGTQVNVAEPGKNSYQGIHGQPVPEGSTVTTAQDTRVQLVYPNGSVTRFDSHSQVTLTDEPDQSSGGTVFVSDGRTWDRIRKLLGITKPFESESGTVLATVRGTSFGHALTKDADRSTIDNIYTVEGLGLGKFLGPICSLAQEAIRSKHIAYMPGDSIVEHQLAFIERFQYPLCIKGTSTVLVTYSLKHTSGNFWFPL